MRKLLMGLIIVLLVILCVIAMTKGLQIANLKVLSFSQIDSQNEKLDKEIADVDRLVNAEYRAKENERNTASNNMQNAKAEYLKYTNLSTNAEILEAMQEKSYKIEFLWTKLGTHARQQGVVLKFEIVSSSTGANKVNDIKFTVDGTYTAITNFIYAIENDTDLNFRVENFKMIPYTSDIILEATFNVRNVIVEGNTSSRTTTKQTDTSDDKDNKTSTSNENNKENQNNQTNTTNETAQTNTTSETTANTIE